MDGWFVTENHIEIWMNSGYPYFRKPPYEKRGDPPKILGFGCQNGLRTWMIWGTPVPPHFRKPPQLNEILVGGFNSVLLCFNMFQPYLG